MTLTLKTVRLAALASSLAAIVFVLAPANVLPATAQTTTGNLFTGTEATFTAGTGGWAGVGAALAAVVPSGQTTGELQITSASPNGTEIGVVSGSGASTWTPIVGGTRLAATASVMPATTPEQVQPLIGFYSAAGAYLTGAVGELQTEASGTWTPLAQTVGVAPTNAAYAIYGVLIYGVANGAVQYLESPVMTQTTVVNPPVVGPLTTLGNTIRQGNGSTIVFRGVVIGGTELSAPTFPTDAEIGQMQAWGANFIRVPLSESDWLNTCTTAAPTNLASYPANVAAEVSSITSRGMVALLDLHYSVTATCGASGLQPMADEQYAPTFWTDVAGMFKSNPLVAFDLFNEPNSISDLVWADGGAVTAGGGFTAAGMQQLYGDVRGTGATNLVFASGNNYGNSPSLVPLVGINIVNAVHDYTCPNLAPPNCADTTPYNPEPFLQNWTVVGLTEPVMVTETGWPDPNNPQFNQVMINDVNAMGWGWAIFSVDTSPGLLFDLTGAVGTTWEPSPSGMPVVVGLEAN